MVKQKFRRAVSWLLTLCVCASMTVTTAVSVSANPIVEGLADFALEKLFDTGMRIGSLAAGELADATGAAGADGFSAAFSFINEWVFMDDAEVGIEEIKELCEDILHELDKISTQIDNSLSIVDSVLATQNINTEKKNVDDRWTSDVTDVIEGGYHAGAALNAYRAYLTDAVDGASEERLREDLDELIYGFSNMYGGSISMDQNNPEALKAILFRDTRMNNSFENMISTLGGKLVGDSVSSGSVAYYAARFAYAAYPFSHQQYTYVYNMMYKQIMEIILVEMMYNEYLYQQGVYLEENGGAGSDDYKGYLNCQKKFYNLMTQGENCVNACIEKMLDGKYKVDEQGGVYLSLADYMRPEDAVLTNLSIIGYENSHDFWQEAQDMANAYSVPSAFIRDSVSKAKYVGRTMKFQKVMTHSPKGNQVYYILDPVSYCADKGNASSPGEIADKQHLMYACFLDNKIDITGYTDVHTPTCDYVNLMKDMSDGINVFAAPDDYGCTALQGLFATNSFLANGSDIGAYLDGYIPRNESAVSVLTTLRRYNNSRWNTSTSWVKYKVLTTSKKYSAGVSIDSDDGEDELDMKVCEDSTDHLYTVILANKNSTFLNNVSSDVRSLNGDNGKGDLTIQADGSPTVINSGENMNVESSKELTVRFKVSSGTFLSLKLARSGARTETLLSQNDLKNLTPSSDGFYEMHVPMPYSNAGFILEIDGQSFSASLASAGDGRVGFDENAISSSGSFRQGETVYLYAVPAEGSALHSMYMYDGKGSIISKDFTHCGQLPGDSGTEVYSFVMPSQNISIKVNFVSGVSVRIDTDCFVYDDRGEPSSYLYFVDEVGATERTYAPGFYVTIGVRNDEQHYFDGMTVIGAESGKEYKLTNSGDSFVFSLEREDVLVSAKFVSERPAEQIFGIRTYDELCEFADRIQSDYADYKNAEVWLENNIVAPDDSEWTLTVGTADKPFEGTFDGNGYAVIGLNMSAAGYGGMFGVIGENGLVKDLAVIDCDYTQSPVYGGGIAAVNKGTIDHCISGINVSMTRSVILPSVKRARLSDYNSFVTGTNCGGVASINEGTIIGTRSGAFVSGENNGGIVWRNDGIIYGCANNGTLGRNASGVKNCGGIAVINNGMIASSYNSGKPNGSKAELALVAVQNDSPDVKSVFFNAINDLLPLGSGSSVPLDDSNALVSNSDMMESAFVDLLNSVSDERVIWQQTTYGNSYLNCGFPTIKGSFFKNRTIAAGSGITLSGNMHGSLNVEYSSVSEGEEYETLLAALGKEAADNNENGANGSATAAVLAAAVAQIITVSSAAPVSGRSVSAFYAPLVTDDQGRFVPAELWCEGVTISVPVNSGDALITFIDGSGELQVVRPESVENGKASFTAAEPVAFAVLEKTAPAPDEGSSRIPDSSEPSPSDGIIRTGDCSPVLPAALAFASAFTVIFVLWKRRKRYE